MSLRRFAYVPLYNIKIAWCSVGLQHKTAGRPCQNKLIDNFRMFEPMEKTLKKPDILCVLSNIVNIVVVLPHLETGVNGLMLNRYIIRGHQNGWWDVFCYR